MKMMSGFSTMARCVALPLIYVVGVVCAQASERGEFELRVATALLNGQSGEYVSDPYGIHTGIPGYKLSELQWQLDNVLMLGVGVSYRANGRLSLNVDYWMLDIDIPPLDIDRDGDGVMDDYDWLIEGMDWTHWSHHDNTTVTDATKFDLNADFTLHSDTAAGYAVNAKVGYRQDRFGWGSVGGYGIYTDTTFRDTPVLFPDIPVITYEQTYRTPYLGLSLSAAGVGEGKRISLDASVRYSRWVRGDDVDVHILRDLRFETGGSGGSWREYGVSLSYLLDERLTLSLAYADQEYGETRGNTFVTDLLTGVMSMVPGETGSLDHHSRQISLGLRYAL